MEQCRVLKEDLLDSSLIQEYQLGNIKKTCQDDLLMSAVGSQKFQELISQRS